MGVGGQGRPTLLTLQMPLTFASFLKCTLNYSVRQAAGRCMIFFATGHVRRVPRRRDRCLAAESVGGWEGFGGDNLLRLVANLHWETRHQTLQIKAGALIKMSAVFLYPPFFVLPVTPSHPPTPPSRRTPPSQSQTSIVNICVKCHKCVLACFKRCVGPGGGANAVLQG